MVLKKFETICTLWILSIFADKRHEINSNIPRKLNTAIEYEQLQKAFYSGDEIALKYDRSTFNEALTEALTKVCVIASKDRKIEFHLIDVNDKTDRNVKQFTDALCHEFNALNELVPVGTSTLTHAQDLVDFITQMIKNIKFCVIMTGNERDAYTLFEVLNDRAMEIDDLELIKNLFLKTYCTTSGDQDVIVDQNIGELDRLWGDLIFTRDMTVTHTKLVSYLGTIYLTADERAFINKVERYREIIDSSYLKKYNKDTNPYTFMQAKNDIQVYHMAKLILKEYEIPVNSAANACIKAEDDKSVSITYRTFHLLNALNQKGVMAALSNMVIRFYMDKLQAIGKKEVDIDDFKSYLKKLKEDNKHEGYSTIHQLAFKLWKTALLCKDWEMPREFAKKGIQNISKDCCNISNVTIDLATHSKMVKQFKDWLQNWQYGKGNDLKVKVLFINLFKSKKTPDSNALTLDTAVYTFTTDKLQLDHMEAEHPNESNMAKHFKPSDEHEQREQYINHLGNFMILDNENNNNKNNKPLKEAMVYYENMCAGHWLNAETDQLLEKYHKEVIIDNESFCVPNEQFFNERKARLIHYFSKIVDRELKDTNIQL